MNHPSNFIKTVDDSRPSKRSEGGFTIIEVMIVLAIAGLILLIVFLAVPAITRSSNNTARKEDASRIATAISSFITNNGVMPGMEPGYQDQADWITDCQTFSTDIGKLSEFGTNGNLSPWCVNDPTHATNPDEFVWDGTWIGQISDPNDLNTDWLVYTEAAICPNTTSLSATPSAGSAKQSILLYPLLQASGGPSVGCIQVS